MADPGSSPKSTPNSPGETEGEPVEAAHQPKHGAVPDDTTSTAKDAMDAAKETATTAVASARELAAEAKARASEAAAEAKQRAAEAVDAARARAAEAREAAKAKLDRPDSRPASVTTAAPTAPTEPSVGELVSTATTAMSALVRSEIELAKLELRSTVKNAGTGLGLFLGAVVVLVFSLTFGFIALAEGINALGLARWLSFLIVFGFQLLVVALFVFIGIKKVKAVRAPERTIKTTKETVGYLKSKRG